MGVIFKKKKQKPEHFSERGIEKERGIINEEDGKSKQQ